jgi:chromosome partitioning protein
VAIFTTKGGVLKTTLALNVARMAALHNIRTCVVGLDLQGDITSALGFNSDLEDAEDMNAAIERINSARGLGDVFQRNCSVEDVVQPTDIPTLFAIPETADLVALDRGISTRSRREYWLREQVIAPLREQFELIILDCSPNWNQLISNALAACDVLISPLECKINQFRNLQVFQALTGEYRDELKLRYDHIYVPTRFASTRKLSAEIRSWYLANIPGVTHGCIRESVQGEESVAAHLSLPEHVATSLVADEMRELLKEIWERMLAEAKREASKVPTIGIQQTEMLTAEAAV